MDEKQFFPVCCLFHEKKAKKMSDSNLYFKECVDILKILGSFYVLSSLYCFDGGFVGLKDSFACLFTKSSS